MKRKRHTEEHIIAILQKAEAGLPVPDLLRKHGTRQQTDYRWKSKYGGLEASEAQRLKPLVAHRMTRPSEPGSRNSSGSIGVGVWTPSRICFDMKVGQTTTNRCTGNYP